MLSEIGSLLIVVSSATYGNGDWRGVVESLRVKHEGVRSEVLVSAPGVEDSLEGVRDRRPRYLAFVMRPEEVDFKTVLKLRRLVREVDDDPYDDAIWGIVTGPDAASAKRIASSFEPRAITSVLSTTGVGDDLVDGPVTRFSDGYPEGEWSVKKAGGTAEKHRRDGDISDVFAEAWREIDPDLIVTSSHASQRNLEMPFSRGNIIAKNGVFCTYPDFKLIDYSTGRFKGPQGGEAKAVALVAPKREKVWVAAGNCLIADNLPSGGTDSMAMTALGFGKVNQFVGYTATTWFGEIGWDTWRYFGSYGYPLNESYFAANQYLLYKLSLSTEGAEKFKPEFNSAAEYDHLLSQVKDSHITLKHRVDPQQLCGILWDRDATVFYGDPLQRTGIENARRRARPKWDEKALPLLIVFPEAKRGRRLVSAPDGFEVVTADDFALVVKWPELSDGWEHQLTWSDF